MQLEKTLAYDADFIKNKCVADIQICISSTVVHACFLHSFKCQLFTPRYFIKLFQLGSFPSPGFDYLKRAEQTCIHIHQGTCIVELSTIVWCREYGNQLPVCEEFETIFNNLSTKERKLISRRIKDHISKQVFSHILNVHGKCGTCDIAHQKRTVNFLSYHRLYTIMRISQIT